MSILKTIPPLFLLYWSCISHHKGLHDFLNRCQKPVVCFINVPLFTALTLLFAQLLYLNCTVFFLSLNKNNLPLGD